jgi:hypothetical protein
MDTLTSKHGLSSVNPSLPVYQHEVEALPPDLRQELERLEKEFSVDAQKLKEISQQFEQELQDGLDKYGSNIVSLPIKWQYHLLTSAVHECDLGTRMARRRREWLLLDS